MSRWIDLSHELAPSMPTDPGDPDVAFAPSATVARDGYEVHSLRRGTHPGTEDARIVLIATGWDRFCGTESYFSQPTVSSELEEITIPPRVAASMRNIIGLLTAAGLRIGKVLRFTVPDFDVNELFCGFIVSAPTTNRATKALVDFTTRLVLAVAIR